MRTLQRLSAVLLAVVLLCCPGPAWAAPSVEVSGSADVVITDLSASHSAWASADAAREGDSRAVMEASLAAPGAWANFTLTVVNRGTKAAVLSQVLQRDDTPDNILVSFGISNEDAGETLSPGQSCTVTIVAQVDPALTDAALASSGDFALTLVYDAAGDSPKTGDTAPVIPAFTAMAISFTAIALLSKKRTQN